MRTAHVPCDSCTACCRNQLVALLPEYGDVLDSLQHHMLNGIPVLDEKENGDCIYLKDGACSIWERRPAMCRAFDCRLHFMQFTRTQRRRMMKEGRAAREIFEAGRKRLHTLAEDSP